MDPPRKGLSPDVIDAVDKMDPRRLVYISCDPATLARDVALFKERGYALRGVEALDLFPRCAHVETVVLMSRNEGSAWAAVHVLKETVEKRDNHVTSIMRL